MTQSFERAKSRLANIETIKPLLTALRTMSMGAWQMANNKIAKMKMYENYYDRILFEILPHIDQKRRRRQTTIAISPTIADTIYLLIGSERGLCGRFNIAMVENALSYIDQRGQSSFQIWVMGSRLLRELERKGVQVSWRKPLPASSLTSYQQSYVFTQNWLEQYEAYAFNQFIVLYNQTVRDGVYEFSSLNLLPYEINYTGNVKQNAQGQWPPPIIETDPKGIYNQIIQHFIASSFHQALLKSAAAEHSTRYNLMQEASENADEIIEELVRVINAERKRKITQELQELAVSAGLLQHK
jgi:F-type H+-transporting ATPase subunit gamma